MLRALRHLLVLAMVVLAGLTVALGLSSAAPSYPDPDPDPFYWAPDNLASMAPGEVVRIRPIPAAQMAFFPMADGWNIAFRSTNSHGDPIMGMTTLFKPKGVASPPLVSYQAIVNSLGTKCSPSRSIWNLELQDAPGFEIPLARGWALNVPDHLGPYVAYGAARLGGMITLDSVRAVKRATELGLTNSPTVLAGYSGGGLSSAWAAALQPTYAPELNLAGVAAGGIPADFEAMIRSVGFERTPGFGLGGAAAIGMEREYPGELPVSDYLNAKGLRFRDFATNECRRFLLIGGFMKSARDVITSTDLTESESAKKVIRDNSLRFFDQIPNVPLYFWQGRADAMTPYDAVAEVAGRYCAAHATLDFRTYEGTEHMLTAAAGFPAAWDWVERRFRGEPAPSNCRI